MKTTKQQFEKEFAAYEAKRDAESIEGEYGHGNWVAYVDGIAYHYTTARKAKEFANAVSRENGGKSVAIYQIAAGSDVLQFRSVKGRCRMVQS